MLIHIILASFLSDQTGCMSNHVHGLKYDRLIEKKNYLQAWIQCEKRTENYAGNNLATRDSSFYFT